MNPPTKLLTALIETLRTAEKSGTNTQDMLNATLTFAAAVICVSAEPEDRPEILDLFITRLRNHPLNKETAQ